MHFTGLPRLFRGGLAAGETPCGQFEARMPWGASVA